MGKKVTITCEEGNFLIRMSAGFGLPEKLGETQKYSVAERACAGEEVRKLFKELKKHSPMTKKPERWILFGPEDNFREIKGEDGNIGWRMANLNEEVEIELNADAMSGAVWCMVLALHPMSPVVKSVGQQEDIIWPLAEKLKKVKVLREEIKLADAKPRRWKDDDEEERSGEERRKEDEAKVESKKGERSEKKTE